MDDNVDVEITLVIYGAAVSHSVVVAKVDDDEFIARLERLHLKDPHFADGLIVVDGDVEEVVSCDGGVFSLVVVEVDVVFVMVGDDDVLLSVDDTFIVVGVGLVLLLITRTSQSEIG